MKLSSRRPERPSHFWTFQSIFCFAAAAFFCGSSIAQSTTGEFDPWQGIEKDGRIPKIEKPADLTNPERWRYIPEGRLKPGNVFQRFLVSSFMAPFFFRDSDVGFGGGIAITDLDFRQQRRREFAGLFASYTTEGQQALPYGVAPKTPSPRGPRRWSPSGRAQLPQSLGRLRKISHPPILRFRGGNE